MRKSGFGVIRAAFDAERTIAALVFKTWKGCYGIDHWLLTDGDEANIGTVKIKYHSYNATNEKGGNEDRHSSPERVKPACVARKAAGNSGYPEKREQHKDRNIVSQCWKAFSLVVDHVVQRLDK